MHRYFRRRDEQGVALISAIMVGFIGTMFVMTMMYVAFHDQTSSARNRAWGQSLHVAESGVHQAIAYLQNSNGVVPSTTVTGTTEEGTYEYRIQAFSRNRYQIDAIGTVGTKASQMATRRLRVSMAPPISFKYALFSLSDVTTKNNNNVCGDIYANTYVVVYENDLVRAATNPGCPDGATGEGNVVAATSYVQMDNGSEIEGSVWSGGYNSSGYGIAMSNGTEIGGDAKSSSSTAGCTDDAGQTKYKIGDSGTIGGSATAWGTITGTVAGTTSAATCTIASPTKPIPTFTFNPANYPAGTVRTYDFPTDYATFNSYIAANKNNLSGTFYITGGGGTTPVSLDDVTVSGDLTVIATDAPIDASGGMDATAGTDKIVVLASWYAPSGGGSSCTTTGGNPEDCAIGMMNNFDMSAGDLSDGDNTAVLLYAPNGPVAFKNNAEFHGAVYASNIQIKNNMDVAYDARLDQIVGFGVATLDIEAWEECDPGPVTASSCA